MSRFPPELDIFQASIFNITVKIVYAAFVEAIQIPLEVIRNFISRNIPYRAIMTAIKNKRDNNTVMIK